MLDELTPTPRVELEPADGATIVAVHGEIDLTSHDELRTTLMVAVESSATVLVDLCRCTFMDSSGLKALVDARRRAIARRVALAIACEPDDAPALVIDLAMPDLFDLLPDRAAGLAFLRSAA